MKEPVSEAVLCLAKIYPKVLSLIDKELDRMEVQDFVKIELHLTAHDISTNFEVMRSFAVNQIYDWNIEHKKEEE